MDSRADVKVWEEKKKEGRDVSVTLYQSLYTSHCDTGPPAVAQEHGEVHVTALHDNVHLLRLLAHLRGSE